MNSVGRNQNPRSGRAQRAGTSRRPPATPLATSSSIFSSWARELIAPTSVFLSSGSPTRSVCSRSLSLSTARSKTGSCTSRREPAQHTWPWLKKMPLTMPSTAWSSGASSKTMFAALPPSSSVRRLPVPAIVRRMILPTSVEPVKATLSTGDSTSAAPVSPAPVTMFTTPGGSSASWITSASSSAVSGVVSAGLSTAVFPVASAGASFQAAISSGKFHGMIWPATPSGRRRPARERVLELVGPARVVEEVRRGERHVDVARLLDRLAAVHRLQDRELPRAFLERRAIRYRYFARSDRAASANAARTHRARRRRPGPHPRARPPRPRRASPRWPG